MCLYSVKLMDSSGVFPTNQDASTYAKDYCHTHPCCLVAALQYGYHVCVLPLKVEGVNQPLTQRMGVQ